jgi:uncharacterized protein
MPALPVLFKTVSSDCNLDCAYCYYRESLEGTRPGRRIEPATLEAFLSEYMQYISDAKVASLSWQGGEPTLAGIQFFQRAVALEAKYAVPGTTISNALQTNGILLDDRWGEFLAAYSFLAGVSLDGPEQVHDSVRRDRGGHGSFRRVMAGIDVLRRHGVEFNILCVVGPHNVTRVRELTGFFRGEGLEYLQFMPAMNFQSVEPEKPPAYLITAAEYGDFLVSLFDEWHENGFPATSVRTFDAILQSYLGVPNGLCVYSDQCDSGVVVEYNGDVYPCDFYVSDDHCLGNVTEMSLESILERPERQAFVERKSLLPEPCVTCRWRRVCKGGCPRNRPGQAGRPEYFCESHRQLFEHADGRFRELANRIKRRMSAAQAAGAAAVREGRAGARNDPCPCGSGRKYKACCGDPRASRSYLLRL